MFKYQICFIYFCTCIYQYAFANSSYFINTPKKTSSKKIYKQISEYTSKDYNNHKNLLIAAKKGIILSLKNCLNQGINPDARVLTDVVNGPSALMEAIGERRHKAVTTLLENDANPNLKARANGIGGISALMIAAIHGPLETLEALIEAGADINAKTSGIVAGSTALMAAIGSDQDILVARLIRAGADVNAKTSNTEISNISTLMIAAEKGNFNITKQLLSSPEIDLEATDSEQKNALVYAYISGNLDLVELLLAKGLRSSLSPAKLRKILTSQSYKTSPSIGCSTKSSCPR